MKREAILLEQLNKAGGVLSSSYLAKHLNVSTRTIRTYVKKINDEINKEVIISTNRGYKINKDYYNEAYYEFTEEDNRSLTMEGRINYIINALLRSNKKINIYDLSDELNISESTLLLDMKKVREHLEENSLELVRKGDYISFKGDERRKRTLIRKIISTEAHDQITNFFTNQDIVTDFEVGRIKDLIVSQLERHHLEINEFVLSNLTLHFIVAVMRLKTNQFIEEDEIQGDCTTVEYSIIEDIFKDLCKEDKDLKVTKEEIYSLSIFLLGNTVEKNMESIEDEEISKLLDKIIEEVNTNFLVNLDHEDFRFRFAIHLKNLINRAKKNIKNINPMVHSLKNNYPLIYDIGLFISSIISEYTGYDISEDETAYISLHIGVYFNEENNDEKVKITIICPKYHNMEKQIIDNLNHHFKDLIEIEDVVDSYTDIVNIIDSELIVTTIPYNGENGQEVVQLLPYFNMTDINKIEKSIQKIVKNKKISFYKSLVLKYFREDVFYTNIIKKDKEEYLEFIGNNLIEKNLIDEKYYKSVLDREEMSSTSFGNVA